MEQKEIDDLIEKNKNSEFQNCFQCEWFPKDISKSIGKPHKSIGYCWSKPNIEKLEFRCNYLRKNVSQAITPFQSNHCLCFSEIGFQKRGIESVKKKVI